MALRLDSAPARPRLSAEARAPQVQLLWYRAGLVCGDLALIVSAVALALQLTAGFSASFTIGQDRPVPIPYWSLLLVVPLIFQALLALQGAYQARALGVGVGEYKDVAVAAGMVGAGLAIAAYLSQSTLSRAVFALSLGLIAVLLLLWRYSARQLLHALRRRGHLLQSVIVVGDVQHVTELMSVLRREVWTGYEVVGVCLPADSRRSSLMNVPVLGEPAEIRQALVSTQASTVFLTAGGGVTSRDFRRVTWQLEGTGAQIAVVPSLTDVAGPRISVRPVAGLPLLHLELPSFSGPQAFLKRSIDVAAAACGLLLLALPTLLIGLLIKLDSAGPVIFRQVRVGRDGEEFWCWKFRTMSLDAERQLVDLLERSDGNGMLFKMREDPRVTRVGRVLRRLSLDELPQLVNVLRGEMSLVGPRPPLPVEVAQYDEDLRRRLMVRPGMTGLWQISGRSELSVEESTRLDLYYIDNWSVMEDIAILWKTVRAVISGRGAF